MLVTKRETETGKVQGEFYGEKITADFSETRKGKGSSAKAKAKRATSN
jgi:hypothetical protein